MSDLAISNFRYAFNSWTPGGALLGVGIVFLIVVIVGKLTS